MICARIPFAGILGCPSGVKIPPFCWLKSLKIEVEITGRWGDYPNE